MVREGGLIVAFFLVAAIATVAIHKIWSRAVARTAVAASLDESVPLALRVATAATERSDAGKQLFAAGLMRKRLAPPIATNPAP